MGTPAEERLRLDDCDGFGGFAAAHTEKMPDAPPLLLAGTDDDGTEPHICRGID